MARWERLKAGTIADTDVLKAITRRAFLKSAENVADLWVRDDGAFIKIRGFRGSFRPGNIFQVKIPASQFREGIEQYVRELLTYIPEPGPVQEPEIGWKGWILTIEKRGEVLVMTHSALGFLTDEELKSVRDYLAKTVVKIDEMLKERDGRE